MCTESDYFDLLEAHSFLESYTFILKNSKPFFKYMAGLVRKINYKLAQKTYLDISQTKFRSLL